MCELFLCFFLLGELSGQVLSFAANTIYMAISCSNLQPKTEPSDSSTTGEKRMLNAKSLSQHLSNAALNALVSVCNHSGWHCVTAWGETNINSSFFIPLFLLFASFMLFPMSPLKMECRLLAHFLARLGSLGALVHYRPASSRERKAPKEPVTSTSFCWCGPLYSFKCGSTCGSCSSCQSLWLVTPHTHEDALMHSLFTLF